MTTPDTGFLRFLALKMTADNIFPPQETAAPMTAQTVAGFWRKWARKAKKSGGMAGVYVHIPFCAQKCTYCCCGSWKPKSSAELDAHCAGLKREMQLLAPALEGLRIRTLYFGGGSPSILNAKQLEDILESLNVSFNLSALEQFNFEAMPQNITPEKLAILKRHGANRVTLGIQTISPAALKIIARKQDAQMVEKAIGMVRAAGIRDLNVDFVAGLPGETKESFCLGLARILRQRPEMVHIYAFQNREDTLYYKTGGKYTDSDRALCAEMVRAGKYILEKAGYRHRLGDSYGLRDSAVNLQEYDRGFNNASYMAFGYPARSHISGTLSYFSGFEHYSGRQIKYFAQKLSPLDEMRKYAVQHIWGGVSKQEFRKKFGRDFAATFKWELDSLSRANVLKDEDGMIALATPNRLEAEVYGRIFFGKKTLGALRRYFEKSYDPQKNYDAELKLRYGDNL
jgi:oxygen-independent coproporphyrinogen-3 oxidase